MNSSFKKFTGISTWLVRDQIFCETKLYFGLLRRFDHVSTKFIPRWTFLNSFFFLNIDSVYCAVFSVYKIQILVKAIHPFLWDSSYDVDRQNRFWHLWGDILRKFSLLSNKRKWSIHVSQFAHVIVHFIIMFKFKHLREILYLHLQIYFLIWTDRIAKTFNSVYLQLQIFFLIYFICKYVSLSEPVE